jgi:hypothetical protein
MRNCERDDRRRNLRLVNCWNYRWGLLTTDNAGLKEGTRQVAVGERTVVIGVEVIIEINGNRIRALDGMSSYLEWYTLLGQTVGVVVGRENQVLPLSPTLGARS